ncbi:hypothetical protein E4T56_gene12724 [Termitomyces sp. T112]|nr:hypothetical protein E4T56_gene12724 [Termitomyces sp. T112]
MGRPSALLCHVWSGPPLSTLPAVAPPSLLAVLHPLHSPTQIPASKPNLDSPHPSALSLRPSPIPALQRYMLYTNSVRLSTSHVLYNMEDILTSLAGLQHWFFKLALLSMLGTVGTLEWYSSSNVNDDMLKDSLGPLPNTTPRLGGPAPAQPLLQNALLSLLSALLFGTQELLAPSPPSSSAWGDGSVTPEQIEKVVPGPEKNPGMSLPLPQTTLFDLLLYSAQTLTQLSSDGKGVEDNVGDADEDSEEDI